MALPVETYEAVEASSAAAAGLVVRCTTHRSQTYLDFATDDGIRTVRLDYLPDVATARAVAGTMRHVASVRFDVAGEQIDCTVRGIAHRSPRTITVSIAVALGFVRQGLVGLVVQRGDA